MAKLFSVIFIVVSHEFFLWLCITFSAWCAIIMLFKRTLCLFFVCQSRHVTRSLTEMNGLFGMRCWNFNLYTLKTIDHFVFGCCSFFDSWLSVYSLNWWKMVVDSWISINAHLLGMSFEHLCESIIFFLIFLMI